MSDFSIEAATNDHINDLARIHVASKCEAYKHIVDGDFLASKTQEEYQAKWAGWLSEDGIEVSILSLDGHYCGFVSYGRMQTPPPGTSKIRPVYSAEIFAIHVHPDHWRQGCGLELLNHAADTLKNQKHKSLCLWVLKDNKNAIGFYDHLNGQRLGKRDVEVGPNKVKEVCYGWRDMSVISTGR